MLEKSKLKKLNDYCYIVEKENNMNVSGKIFISEKLMETLEDESVEQVKNVAKLPGIVGESIAMSDAHLGYGFTIGGVAAFDAKKGIISPGGIGFDINCGVRVIITPLTKREVFPKMKELISSIYRKVPVGAEKNKNLSLSSKELNQVLERGVDWVLENRMAQPEDKLFSEEEGHMLGADHSKVSDRAKNRGHSQLGTLGSGNHFLEIQYAHTIFDEEVARIFGITEPDQVVVMIHCGSRGLGHQVCSDYIRRMENEQPEIVDSLPDKNLIYAPINSKVAKDYYAAMCAAANFAWANRTVIAHSVRKSFQEIFGIDPSSIKTLYDVSHNIAKKETHIVNGEKKEVLVHRKGATRCFPKNHPDVPEKYRTVGQPVLIPGSMGTASYILVGEEGSMEKSFGSSTHGAGRVMSRHKAKKLFSAEKTKKEMKEKGIELKAGSSKGIVEEVDQVYKDIESVVEVSKKAHLARPVVRLKPLGVIKG